MNHRKAATTRRGTHSIAEGTGLQALNAAIEAVLAAEAGHGFAVAAEQVKSLADHAKMARQAIDPTAAFGGGLFGVKALPH